MLYSIIINQTYEKIMYLNLAGKYDRDVKPDDFLEKFLKQLFFMITISDIVGGDFKQWDVPFPCLWNVFQLDYLPLEHVLSITK